MHTSHFEIAIIASSVVLLYIFFHNKLCKWCIIAVVNAHPLSLFYVHILNNV